MKYVQGDLIADAAAGSYDVIVQGCNCFNTMGSGLALSLRRAYPEVYKADCATRSGDKNKLGTYTKALVGSKDHSFYVINAYTQYRYGVTPMRPDLFEYESFSRILRSLRAEFPDKRFGFPLIGCERAGGDKDRILAILKDEFAGMDYTVVEYAPAASSQPRPPLP